MNKYVITIEPEADEGAPTTAAQTTVRIDATTGQVRITELTVRAGQGQGLDPADLPAMDLGLLVRALTAPARTAALPAPEAVPVTAEPAGPARRRGRRPAPAGKRTGRSRKAAKATGADKSGKRAYRRMPDPASVLDAYARTGSLSGVAAHFDVPRHTVAGWARRLREQGHAIGGR